MMNEQIIKSAEKPGLVVLTGPTAVGKTALSIRLARAIKGEIISADSMQVYRGMDIGSAKIREEEKEGIPHHLIDVLDPEESFDVVRFQSMAKEAARKIRAAGHIPIVTGGTGFYIQALLYDIDFTENDADRSFRDRLEAIAETEDGPALLHRMLEEADPESAALIMKIISSGRSGPWNSTGRPDRRSPSTTSRSVPGPLLTISPILSSTTIVRKYMTALTEGSIS
jgi:tRNA dimethylallyltransferase